MLKKEAEWFGKKLKLIPDNQLGKVLDVGSGSLFFRVIRQYWIDKFIFTPLRKRGIEVIHSDIEIDVVSSNFVKKTKKLGNFKTVFACNLLEHISDYRKAARNLSSLMSGGGLLFVSCPRKFPYHPDPIDNMLRPGVDELSALFPKFEIVWKTIVKERHTLSMNSRAGIFLNQEFSSTCLILQKK